MDWVVLITTLIEIFSNCDFNNPDELRQRIDSQPLRFRLGVVRAIRKLQPGISLEELRDQTSEVIKQIREAHVSELNAFCHMCEDFKKQGTVR